MDCKSARSLIDADLDGELDLVRHLEVEEHVAGCAECARRRNNAQARRAVLQESLPRFIAPAGLAERIRERLAAAQPPTKTPQASAPQSIDPAGMAGGSGSWRNVFFAMAASVAAAFVVGYNWGGARARSEQLLNEAVSEHIRSLQMNHLSDVISTDQHTVRPWFAGKLDFSPPVPDLASIGFPLSGGRLERIAGKPAAALVYHRRLHALNVFIWQSGSDAIADQANALSGYHTQTWNSSGFNYLAVSEISAEELKTFTAAFRAAIGR